MVDHFLAPPPKVAYKGDKLQLAGGRFITKLSQNGFLKTFWPHIQLQTTFTIVCALPSC